MFHTPNLKILELKVSSQEKDIFARTTLEITLFFGGKQIDGGSQ